MMCVHFLFFFFFFLFFYRAYKSISILSPLVQVLLLCVISILVLVHHYNRFFLEKHYYFIYYPRDIYFYVKFPYFFKVYKAISDSLENCRIINCIMFSIVQYYLIFIIKLWWVIYMHENINKTIMFVQKNPVVQLCKI